MVTSRIWFTAAQKAELLGAMEEWAKCCGGRVNLCSLESC
jgi:hypothetical protein